MNRTPSRSKAEEFFARVQRMAKWIAGHGVEVETLMDGDLGICVGEDRFTVPVNSFPDEMTIARCALALGAAGTIHNFNVGDFDEETIWQLLPASARWQWRACGRTVTPNKDYE